MIVHSFVQIPALINNIPKQVSPIGELSPNSATFSREVGYYSSASYPSVKLATFSSLEGETPVQVPVGVRNSLLAAAEWIYLTSKDGSFTDDTSNFQQLFQSQYSNYSIEEAGPMIQVDNVYYPSYVVYSEAGNLYSLWFSDLEFDKEYPLYELYPIMPIDNLDALHGQRSDVFDLIDSISVTTLMNRASEVRAEYPFTHQHPLEVNWTDKNDPSVTKPITFLTLIYGNAGKNIDLIKNSLVTHILQNSTYPRSEWEKVLPELFLPNEYYITPMWNDVAVSNLQTRGGIYSPSSNFQQMMDYGTSTFHGLTDQHIADNIEHVVSIYQSIGFVAVGNAKNQTGVFKFGEQWPKFGTVSTLDFSWDRLGPETQGFITTLIEALSYAERWDGESYVNLPNDFTTVDRGNNTYIVFNYDKVNYLVSVYSNEIKSWTGSVGGGEPSPSIPSLEIEAVVGPEFSESFGTTLFLYEIASDGTKTPYPTTELESLNWHAVIYEGSDATEPYAVSGRKLGEDAADGWPAFVFDNQTFSFEVIWRLVVVAEMEYMEDGVKKTKSFSQVIHQPGNYQP